MYTIVLMRHGQSEWNLQNLFTGWMNVSLSPKGIQEATHAGELLREQSFSFDIVYTSVLQRAIKTAELAISQMQCSPTFIKAWQLNERHYGALQGLNKAETAQKYGDEQVHIWRRSYDVPPPALEKSDERYAGNDELYKDLDESQIPLTESLKDTVARVLPYWESEIVPNIKQGKHILIAAHGNSLRALIKHLDSKSDEEIVLEEIPTGTPLVYELDESLKPIKRYYLR